MLPEIGQISLLLALVFSLLLSTIPLWGAHTGNMAFMKSAKPLAYALLISVAFSYALLTVAFLQHDFTVA